VSGNGGNGNSVNGNDGNCSFGFCSRDYESPWVALCALCIWAYYQSVAIRVYFCNTKMIIVCRFSYTALFLSLEATCMEPLFCKSRLVALLLWFLLLVVILAIPRLLWDISGAILASGLQKKGPRADVVTYPTRIVFPCGNRTHKRLEKMTVSCSQSQSRMAKHTGK
jgi:hypothetical protein